MNDVENEIQRINEELHELRGSISKAYAQNNLYSGRIEDLKNELDRQAMKDCKAINEHQRLLNEIEAVHAILDLLPNPPKRVINSTGLYSEDSGKLSLQDRLLSWLFSKNN